MYRNYFISQGLIILLYCCPPGKLTTYKSLKRMGAIHSSYGSNPKLYYVSKCDYIYVYEYVYIMYVQTSSYYLLRYCQYNNNKKSEGKWKGDSNNIKKQTAKYKSKVISLSKYFIISLIFSKNNHFGSINK